MTPEVTPRDLQTARQAVIDAARELYKVSPGWNSALSKGRPLPEARLAAALKDLDDAENPDAWGLIAQMRDDLPSAYWDTGNPDALGHMIDAVLERKGLR